MVYCNCNFIWTNIYRIVPLTRKYYIVSKTEKVSPTKQLMMLVVTIAGKGSILYVWFIAWYEIVETCVFDLGIGFIHVRICTYFMSKYIQTCLMFLHFSHPKLWTQCQKTKNHPWIDFYALDLCHHFGWFSSDLLAAAIPWRAFRRSSSGRSASLTLGMMNPAMTALEGGVNRVNIVWHLVKLWLEGKVYSEKKQTFL